MTSIGIDLSFSFSGLSSPLNVSLSEQSTSGLTFSLSYASNTIDISYDKTTHNANASWTAENGNNLSLGELMAFLGFNSQQTAHIFSASLHSFSLDYNGSQGLAFIDLTTGDGSNAFIAAIKPVKPQTEWKYALGFYLNDTLSLSGLPMVGKSVGQKISASNIHLAYMSAGIASNVITTINERLSAAHIATIGSNQASGLSASAKLDFDNIIPSTTLNTAATSKPNSTSQGASIASQSAGATKGSSVKAGKSIGPMHLQSTSFGFNQGELDVKVNASVALGPLSISLDGLKVSNPLTEFDPSFGLQGLGINYQTSAITIGGAFLKATPTQANVSYEYNGSIDLKIENFQLDAFGSYAKLTDDSESFFIFALADYPLGGPTFCFVTGLAATFGYNRNLIAPPVTGVSTFPLVSAAAGTNTLGNTQQDQSAAMLGQLDQYIPPQEGEYFGGLGVKFDSFKIIDSYALLIAKFGQELEFDLFALSTYKAPDPQDPSPVAVAELEILGRIIPSQGSVMVQGQLTPASFLLDKNCHLTGGFAVGFWASGPYEGDFVYSFGGYGSHYTPPTHYPQNVPAIGLNWQLGSDLSISGGMYWAITPQIIAAGGHLNASLNTSFFKAWFNLDAYFLIEWKPFHYQAGFTVDFGLSVRIDLLFTSVWLGFDISASLQIQGPPFGGTASISLAICTIHVDFGDDASQPVALQWSEFENSFLPPTQNNRVNINLTSGLVKTVKDTKGNQVWLVNPKELSLQTNSFIPCSTYTLNYQKTVKAPAKPTNITIPATDAKGNAVTLTQPGIKPMALASSDVTSSHTLTITGPDKACQLKAVAINTNSPKAIWGNTPAEADNTNNLVSNTLSGFTLQPASGPTPGISHSVSRQNLAWEMDTYTKAYQTPSLTGFSGTQNSSVKQYIQNTNTARTAVLTALGMQNAIPDVTQLQTDLSQPFTPNVMTGTYNKGQTS